MKNVRVALAQIAPKLGDVEVNLEEHLRAIRAARRQRADVVVFPELSLTGYLLKDQVAEVSLRQDAPLFRRLVAASRGIDVVVGLVEETPAHLFHNATVYLSRGRVVHVHRKVYLPTYGMFEEGRDFAPGDRIRTFEASWGTGGLLICEDAWHPACAWLLAQEGLELLLVVSSGPTRGARPGRGITSTRVWHDLLRVSAQFQSAYVLFVNRVGFEDGLNFGGGSIAFDPFGRVVAALPELEAGLVVADLDGEVLRRARIAYPLLRDENLELVRRELERIRRQRFGLPKAGEPEPEPRSR